MSKSSKECAWTSHLRRDQFLEKRQGMNMATMMMTNREEL